MVIITKHHFDKKYINSQSFTTWKDYSWPVVYILKWNKHAYIWETTNIFKRTNDHLKTTERIKYLKKLYILYDPEYNKSATLDIESQLIQHMSADNMLILQNKNEGIKNHHYFDREKYLAKFEEIWKELQQKKIVYKDLNEIKNSDLFKYSPYKSLNNDQYEVVTKIYEQIKTKAHWTHIVKWEPWTWKSVVASFLIKYLKGKEETRNLKIALVIPMTSLRATFKKVFKNVDGLSSKMVIWPSEIVKEFSNNNKTPYDVIIVDESHRLQKRRNITNYKIYDEVNKKLGLDSESTQLDWVLKLSKTQVLLYDSNQSIRPADINQEDFEKIKEAKHYKLKSQMRVEWGNEYLSFVRNLFEKWDVDYNKVKNYDFKIFTNFRKFREAIYSRDKEFWLSRIVAWYAWHRNSKDNPNKHDIEIDWVKMFWNSTNRDWVNSKNALHEIGCIHTVQWYDLNYVGVILWKELSYDRVTREFKVNKEYYHDRNGKRGIKEGYELKRYIINIYKTLMTRGIKGTYIYIVDDALREYLQSKIKQD